MPLLAPDLLETPRLRVRPLLETDLPALLAINSDAEVTKFLGHAPWQGMAEAEAWFRRISAAVANGSALEFVIAARDSGAVIGRAGLFALESGNATADVGYLLGPAHWRRGYMREALTALIGCAFQELGLRRLEARVEAGNVASMALLRRLGFTREGVLRERWLNDGQPIDAEVYGLLQREWSGAGA